MPGTFNKTYAGVTWTEGDIATEEKMDNMVNNDQAHDAFASQGLTLNNTVELKGKESGGTARDLIKIDSSNDIQIGKQNEAGHTVINAGTSKLVKLTVLRQDNTSNTYTSNSVILTGWGFALGHGGAPRTAADTVTFGITFSQIPMIVAVACGYKDNSDPTVITDLAVWDKPNATIHDLAVTSFQVTQGVCDQVNIANTRRVGYSWIAVGQLN